MLHRTEESNKKGKTLFLFFSPLLFSFFFAFTPERTNFHWFTIKIVETRLISDGKLIPWFFIQNPQHLSFIFLLCFSLWNIAPAQKVFLLEKISAKEKKGSRAGFQPGGGSCGAQGSLLPRSPSQPAAAICYANKSRLKSPSGIPLSAAKLSISSGNSLVKSKQCLCWINCPYVKSLLKQHLHPLFPSPPKILHDAVLHRLR